MTNTLANSAETDDLAPDSARRARGLLWSHIRPRWRGFSGVLLLFALHAIAGAFVPACVALAIDRGIPAARAGDWAPLLWITAAFAGLSLITSAAIFTGMRIYPGVAQGILVSLRRQLFAHVQKLGITYTSDSGRLVSRQTSDMDSIHRFAHDGLVDLVIDLIYMATILVALLLLDARLAVVVLIGLVPLLGLTYIAHRAQRKAQRRSRTAIAKVIVQFVETMSGMRAVQSYRRQAPNLERIDAVDSHYRDANIAYLRSIAVFTGGSRFLGNATIAAVVFCGGYLVLTGQTEVGVFTAFLLYLRTFYGPLDNLVHIFSMYQSAAAALEKIVAILDTKPIVVAPTQPASLPASSHGRTLEFAGTSFAYANGTDVFPRFDLRVDAGTTVALVGATGAGKSTLAKLAARFYDPTEGAVLMDGVDISTLSDAELRENIAMVTQEAYMFAGTIADNLRIGKPTASAEDVAAAAAAVGLDTYLDQFPNGYDTDVKKRGGRLSAGQRQLVSFARVFLADPQVIVLDEATAHLDIPTERLVQTALAKILVNRTAIIIAHRLSTVEIADRVLVMDAGTIIEDGSPQDLISAGGRFAHLHTTWKESLA